MKTEDEKWKELFDEVKPKSITKPGVRILEQTKAERVAAAHHSAAFSLQAKGAKTAGPKRSSRARDNKILDVRIHRSASTKETE